jgi:predicted HTH transcriptional regulator
LGVDNEANVKGLDEAQIKRYKVRILDLIREWIEPQAQIHMKTAEALGKKLIIVSIQKGDDPPYNYKDHGVYIRANATDRIASREELIQLKPQENTWG